ncbi:MAG: hypothetical protein WEB13_06040 [Dehalococcoidia bacterium]
MRQAPHRPLLMVRGRSRYRVTGALAEGVRLITVTARDAAGNVSATSLVLTITVLTVAPDAPTGLAIAPASNSGSSTTAIATRVTALQKAAIATVDFASRSAGLGTSCGG